MLAVDGARHHFAANGKPFSFFYPLVTLARGREKWPPFFDFPVTNTTIRLISFP